MMQRIDLFKDLSIIVAGLIAFITLWQGLFQYARQNHAARANQFIQMRRRFLEDAIFRRLLTMIFEGDASIANEPIQDRRNFIAFFEEVALLVNSGLIKPEVAHYMFGFYAIQIDENEPVWSGLNKDGEFWRVFRDFVADMRKIPAPDGKPVRI